MPAPRKVFRIEECMPAHAQGEAGAAAPEQVVHDAALLTELKALRALLKTSGAARRGGGARCNTPICAAPEFKRELDLIHEVIRKTKHDLGGEDHAAGAMPMARLGRELDAVIGDAEQATQNILKAAEDIDQLANTLSALLKGGYVQGLVQDIRDHVVRIFEACNFQDLTGQRVSKVMATLKFIEDHVMRMMELWHAIERFKPIAMAARVERDGGTVLHGPALAGDPGHFSQAEVDALFDGG